MTHERELELINYGNELKARIEILERCVMLASLSTSTAIAVLRGEGLHLFAATLAKTQKEIEQQLKRE